MPNYQFGSSGVVFTDNIFEGVKKAIADKWAKDDAAKTHRGFHEHALRKTETYQDRLKFYMLSEDVRVASFDGLKRLALSFFQVEVKEKPFDGKWLVRLIDEATKNDFDIVGKAVKKGIAIADVKDDDGKTLLHFAAECGLLSVFQTLKQRGADIDACDKNQQTPLHIAVDEGALAIVRELIKPETGANINIKDYSDCTPYDIAEERFEDALDGEEKKRREKIKVIIKIAGGKRGDEVCK